MRLLNLLKEKDIIKITQDYTLAQALKKLRTSHDAAFVFDDEDHFLGLINPYYTLISNSFPSNIKVTSCLFHPPKIYINTPINKVCQFFIQTKVHYLPVFEKNEVFLGIISARRVLTYLKTLPIFEEKVAELIKFKKLPLVIFPETTVSEALSFYKKYKVSKLLVVSPEGILKGILSYYDLIEFLSSPRVREEKGDRKGIKTHFTGKAVRDFYKSTVLTVKKDEKLEKVVNLILEKEIGSVIVVDEKRKPINIITTRDLLNHYLNKSQSGFFKNLASKFQKIIPIKKTA